MYIERLEAFLSYIQNCSERWPAFKLGLRACAFIVVLLAKDEQVAAICYSQDANSQANFFF